jgi:hypothetical protein
MLLEEYLDGELSAADARAVEERAAREPELAAELSRLRGDREVRVKVWHLMEGDERAVEAVAGKVHASIERRECFGRLLRGLRMGGAAAACIMLGLTVGWMARTQPNNTHERVVEAPAVDSPAGGGIQFVGQLPPVQKQGYTVQLKDETGRVVATQAFPTQEQAREFAKDVGDWQERQNQVRNGNITFVGEKF